MRIETVKQFATRADGTDSQEQRDYTDQLARQIQIEPDPLVREAIIRATGEFRTPLAYQMLEAGLRDESSTVRIACCESLGQRAETRCVASLADVVRNDTETDVRLAAVEALGKIKDPSAVAAVAIALNDHDPAMQFVGVQSMQSITGKNYGGDVDAWRQVAAGQSPPEPKATLDRRTHPQRRAVLSPLAGELVSPLDPPQPANTFSPSRRQHRALGKKSRRPHSFATRPGSSPVAPNSLSR